MIPNFEAMARKFGFGAGGARHGSGALPPGLTDYGRACFEAGLRRAEIARQTPSPSGFDNGQAEAIATRILGSADHDREVAP